MDQEEKNKVKNSDASEEIEVYGDPGIASYDAKVPKFLLITYLILPIWGFFALYLFWNGSVGWFDRGYWRELQIVANTTFPNENHNMSWEEENSNEEEEPPIQQLR